MDQIKMGRFIATCRKEKGMTQAQIAEYFSISNRAVSKWETGRSCPDVSIMVELSEILGVTVNELLNGERNNAVNQRKISAEDNSVELCNKMSAYKRRIIINNIFLLIVAFISIFTLPEVIILVIIVMAFRDYYLIKNLRNVKHLIEAKK